MKSALLSGVFAALVMSGMTPANSAASASNRSLGVEVGVAQNEEPFATLDDVFAEVASQVPEFGGMFIGPDETVYIYMVDQVDSSWASVAEDLVAEAVFDGRRLSKTGPKVLIGQYSFLKLKEWHDGMSTPVLEIPGVVMTDIDEAMNRLRIGVEDPQTATVVEAQLADLGIPREAVVIELTEPVELLSSLRDRHRPLVAGLQINFSGFLCTLGFNAVRAGVNGFVTCSHCTDIQGGVEGTIYHQPSASGTTNRIGMETVDPVYFTGGGCPSGKRCRYSDSAFADRPHPQGPSVTASLGMIARPNNNSFAWNGINRFRIVSEASSPVVGQTVTKVGRTTGRNSGPISSTCVNVNVSGTNITQLCQAIVQLSVAGGDSGSPVFRITNSPSTNDVQLQGILWGGGGSTMVFSPISNVQRTGELGAVTTCASGGC